MPSSISRLPARIASPAVPFSIDRNRSAWPTRTASFSAKAASEFRFQALGHAVVLRHRLVADQAFERLAPQAIECLGVGDDGRVGERIGPRRRLDGVAAVAGLGHVDGRAGTAEQRAGHLALVVRAQLVFLAL